MAGKPFEVVTRGFHELEAAFADVAVKVDPTLSAALRALAEPIKGQVRQLAEAWGSAGPGQARTASGVRIRRRKLAVTVEQGLAKTTGLHPEYGGIQMRHFFIPALDQHTAEVEAGIARVIDDLIGTV